jgi:hypothetical protein
VRHAGGPGLLIPRVSIFRCGPKQGSHPSDPSVGKRPFPVAHPPIKPIAPRTYWRLQGCERCTCVNGAAETRRPGHLLHFLRLLRDHSAFRIYQRDTEAFVNARPLLNEIVVAVEHWPSQALPEGRKVAPVISQNLLTSPRLVNDDIATSRAEQHLFPSTHSRT